MLWNSTSSSRVRVTVQIHVALHPCDPLLIKNRNMTVNSVGKCFAVWNSKGFIDSKTCYILLSP